MTKINFLLKRTFDIFSSLLMIFALLPIWICVPIIIKFDSKGPVFFKQERRTKDGEVFKMLKFRSMIENAESIGTGLFNYENDNRVTRVGKVLRKTSIDELPQLFNILIGQMSVIGPRPCVKYELGDFNTLNERFKKRFKMKAGLTGLAQTKGRNDISWDEKVKYDNEYIEKFYKYGVLIDLKLLIDSAIKVLKKDNIYENRVQGTISEIESAKFAEEEIIRIAHLLEEIEVER